MSLEKKNWVRWGAPRKGWCWTAAQTLRHPGGMDGSADARGWVGVIVKAAKSFSQLIVFPVKSDASL